MKFAKAGTLAAVLAVAASGALAQGITGKVVGTTPAERPAVSATGIAPADGSHNLTQPGFDTRGMYRSLDEVRASRAWLPGGYAVPYHVDTRVMGNTTARITSYWVDVEAGVRDDDDFRRWLSLG